MEEAKASESESDDPIGELLKSNTAIFCKRQELLQSGNLKSRRLRQALAQTQDSDRGQSKGQHSHQSVVTSIAFHPRENLMLTSGLDRKAKLVQVKGYSSGLEEYQSSQIVQ